MVMKISTYYWTFYNHWYLFFCFVDGDPQCIFIFYYKNMKKNSLFKWVSVLGAILLLANTVFPGFQAHATTTSEQTTFYVSPNAQTAQYNPFILNYNSDGSLNVEDTIASNNDKFTTLGLSSDEQKKWWVAGFLWTSVSNLDSVVIEVVNISNIWEVVFAKIPETTEWTFETKAFCTTEACSYFIGGDSVTSEDGEKMDSDQAEWPSWTISASLLKDDYDKFVEVEANNETVGYVVNVKSNWNKHYIYVPKLNRIIVSEVSNWSISASADVASSWTEITLTATPNDNYSFWGWTVTDTDNNTITVSNNKFTMPPKDVSVSATFTYKSSSWWNSWGGGGWSSKTSTTNDTKAETGSQNNIKNDDIIKTNEDGNWVDNDESTDSQKALDDWFTQEFHDAYDFAFKNGITTMPSIAEADMNGTLTRIAMAKMLSNYAINVLGKTPDTGKNISFPDVSPELDAQYNSGVTLAYQLWIMGINIDEFRPFDEVTRAEFVTALSRMLFGLTDGENLYYETHMQKLLEEKIITVADPDMKELRWYVMIMLMRSADK